jgi:hypothetical protein
MLTEEEAMYLAVVFEETGAYQYKKNKEMESRSGGSNSSPAQAGLKPGFDEIFSFGEEDTNDYWDKTEVD